MMLYGMYIDYGMYGGLIEGEEVREVRVEGRKEGSYDMFNNVWYDTYKVQSHTSHITHHKKSQYRRPVVVGRLYNFQFSSHDKLSTLFCTT